MNHKVLIKLHIELIMNEFGTESGSFIFYFMWFIFRYYRQLIGNFGAKQGFIVTSCMTIKSH